MSDAGAAYAKLRKDYDVLAAQLAAANGTLARLTEPDYAMVEAIAPVVYTVMQLYNNGRVTYPWVLNGNSLAQDEARRATAKVIHAAVACASAPEVATDV